MKTLYHIVFRSFIVFATVALCDSPLRAQTDSIGADPLKKAIRAAYVKVASSVAAMAEAVEPSYSTDTVRPMVPMMEVVDAASSEINPVEPMTVSREAADSSFFQSSVKPLTAKGLPADTTSSQTPVKPLATLAPKGKNDASGISMAAGDSLRIRMNELMRYIRSVDLMSTRVRPAEAVQFSGDSLPEHFHMSPLFMPMAFRADLDRTLIPVVRLQPREYLYSKEFWKRLGERPFDRREFMGQLYVSQMNHKIMRELQINRIDLVAYGLDQLPEHEKIVKKPVSIQPIRSENIEEVRVAKPDRDVRQAIEGYSYWTFRGRLSNQLTQTYVSPNWSSGGNSNMAGLFSIYWTGKYNDKKKIQFDNTVDVKIGINTASNDTLRHYSVSTDQVHLQSKLGVRAVKNWYYSASADIQTQLLNSYKANTMNLKSALLSPATLFLSLGMDYKISKKGKSLSVLLTPLTYRMNYLLDNENFKPKSYGIEEGKHIGHEFGVKLSSTYDWKISDDISWNSYIYYYSDFTYVESEWKNTFNLTINEYLSTQLFVHLKFDDRTRNAEYPSHFQLKEYLSLGLTYYW